MNISFQFAGGAAVAVTPSSAGVKAAETASLFNVPQAVQSCPPALDRTDGKADSGALRYPVMRKIEEQWSHTKETRFAALAAKKALRKATAEELSELAALRELRRRTKNPPTAAEIIFQHRREQAEAKVLEELQKYVQFLNAPHQA